MKIVRFRHADRIKLGVLEGDEIRDLSRVWPQFEDLPQLLDAMGLDAIAQAVPATTTVRLEDAVLLSPIGFPPVFLGIGLNYAAHITETAHDAPEAPLVFNKQSTCVIGPDDNIIIPAAAPDMVDYEGELAVVIGRRCRGVSSEDAEQYVAGYVIVNDISVRDWQYASPSIMMGKSWDTHGPIGPWVTTKDEVGDPHVLGLRTWVDNELRQDSSTAEMLRNCWELIEHISTAFTLLPGSVIATGTPAGVGARLKPPAFLKPGMRVRIEIDKLGVLENPVVAEVSA